ncbi:MAG: zinc metalloprotease HtpX [Candidatus Sumerlaeia bacterium]
MKGFSTLKTGLLMFGLTLLLVAVGRALDSALGSSMFMYGFLVLSLVMNFISYWFSDQIVLGIYRAREASRGQADWLYRMVERLCRNAGLPMPKLYIIPAPVPNAFATGRNPHHAAVAVTEGLINSLTAEELEGVIAHELAHIKNRDTLISTVVAGIAGVISTIGNLAMWGLMLGGGGGGRNNDNGGGFGALFLLLVAPLLALIIQLMISRQREFAADAGGAYISGRPLALASALEKIELIARSHPMQPAPATAHLFIVNPFRGDLARDWFSTHPSTARRVERLRQLAREMRVFV